MAKRYVEGRAHCQGSAENRYSLRHRSVFGVRPKKEKDTSQTVRALAMGAREGEGRRKLVMIAEEEKVRDSGCSSLGAQAPSGCSSFRLDGKVGLGCVLESCHLGTVS